MKPRKDRLKILAKGIASWTQVSGESIFTLNRSIAFLYSLVHIISSSPGAVTKSFLISSLPGTLETVRRISTTNLPFYRIILNLRAASQPGSFLIFTQVTYNVFVSQSVRVSKMDPAGVSTLVVLITHWSFNIKVGNLCKFSELYTFLWLPTISWGP